MTQNGNNTSKKLALASLLVALAVAGGSLSIPVFVAKCSPIQHMVNILGAILLGPGYAVGVAFVASLLRLLLGSGSLLAFPGSMWGAALAGLLYLKTQKEGLACLGELLGTGLLGGLSSYPVALFLMGREVAMLAFVLPFTISSLGGVILGVLCLKSLQATGILEVWKFQALKQTEKEV